MSPHDNGWTYSTAKIISFYKHTGKGWGVINLEGTGLEIFPQPYPFKLFVKRSSQTSYIELSTNFEDTSTYDTLSFRSEKILSLIPTVSNITETFNIILWCKNWQN